MALARGRERVRVADSLRRRRALPSAAPASGWPSSSAGAKAWLPRVNSSGHCSRSWTSEQAAIDWTPVEAALQTQLAARGEAEQALAAARDKLEALGADLRAAEEARLTAEQKLEPARAKILEMQLKEQAATLAEQQFTEQLAEAHADVTVLPDALKAWGSARTLPGEIERITGAIAELGRRQPGGAGRAGAGARAQGLPRPPGC